MTSNAELQSKVRQLNSRQQIHDCLLRFCRGADHGDIALARSAYHPDAYQDHGIFRGLGYDFVALSGQLSAELESLTHVVANEYVEFDPADDRVAFSETVFLVYMVSRAADGSSLLRTSASRYLDRFEERDGEWKIARRHTVIDWEKEPEPIAGDTGMMAKGGMTRGQLSMSDPSYQLGFRRW